MEVLEPDRYQVTLEVGVGPIKGEYDGTFVVSDKRRGESCTVTASARGLQGSVEAVARVQLAAAENGGSTIVYEADTTMTGPIAGVGQRMVGAAAKRTTREFFAALDQQLLAQGAPPAGGDSVPGLIAGVPADLPSRADAGDRRDAASEQSGAPSAGGAGAVFTRDRNVSAGIDLKSLLCGFILALVAVAVGHWVLT